MASTALALRGTASPVAASPSRLTEIANRFNAMANRVKAMKGQISETTEELADTAIATGTAFAVGVTEGRFGGYIFKKLPVSLTVGAVTKVVGMLGWGGRYSHFLKSAGTGALSLYTGTLGRDVGARWKERSAKPSASTKGDDGSEGADDSIANVARRE